MFIDKWRPVFATEQEVGTPQGQDQGAPPPDTGRQEIEPADGPGSGRSELRKQLEKGFEDDRKASDRQAQQDARKAKGRFARGTTQGDEAEPGEGQEPGQQQEPAERQEGQAQVAAPEAWLREAKAEWANLSPTVQAAIAKREEDSAKGVKALKDQYADYEEVMKPRMQIVRQYGHTPAQAVNQMWLWFEALQNNPMLSFPALAKSFNFDLRALFQQQQQEQQQQPPQPQPGAAPGKDKEAAGGGISPELKAYLDNMQANYNKLAADYQQNFGSLASSFQQQSEAKTKEVLDTWSVGKPYFEEVRQDMAKIIAANMIPLKDGRVDLDGAYDMAIHANREVRAKVIADMEAAKEKARKDKETAEAKARQDQTDKARRASVGVAPGAPGTPAPEQRQQRKGKSVRESLAEAFEQHRS